MNGAGRPAEVAADPDLIVRSLADAHIRKLPPPLETPEELSCGAIEPFRPPQRHTDQNVSFGVQ